MMTLDLVQQMAVLSVLFKRERGIDLQTGRIAVSR
jgi:hypothetical protein